MYNTLKAILMSSVLLANPAMAMTKEDALACLNEMLIDAQAGTSFTALVSEYVDYDSITSYVSSRTGQTMADIETEINNILLKESSDSIDYSLGIKPVGGSRSVTDGFEFWGDYTTGSGRSRRFGVFLTPECRVFDLCDGALCLRRHLANQY